MSVHFEKPSKAKSVPSEQWSTYNASQADTVYNELSELDYHDEPFYSYRGRIGRLRFLAYNMVMGLLLYAVLLVFALVAAGLINAIGNNGFLVVILVVVALAFAAGFVYATLVPAIRRLNDMNYTGWLSLLMLVPYLNILFFLFLALMPGTDGINDYGVPATPPTTRVKVAALFVPVGVFLLGILAAIALPAYQDYINRPKQMEQMYMDRMNNTP